MSNDIDDWNDLESMDKRTKAYKERLKKYVIKYICPSGL